MRESHVHTEIFLKFYFIFKFYIIALVLPNIKMNPPQVYMCSPSWTFLPPPSPYQLSGSSQCASPKHPVSCIEPGLATRFIHDILHVSMPFSQIFPPSPSPTVHKTVLYISVSFAVSYTGLLLPSLLPPPSPYHPSGLSQCPSPKHPVSCHQTWTGNSFHTWYFTCFNAILPYLPTLSLSHSP